MRKLAFLLSFLFASNAYASTVSFDQLAVSSDLTVQKYNRDFDTVYQKLNSNVQTDNIADDTLAETDFADDANPRIRTYEGASCEKVHEGLLPLTTSGTLVGSVPSGTAYPLGYRVVKSSSTPKTWDASKWTFVDIDINGTLTYSAVTIDASTPAVATNSIRLARVSTDGTQVVSVQDLRVTNCASGPFEDISDTAGEATLDDMFSKGAPVRRFSQAGRTPSGFKNGLFVSYDSVNTFKVTSGSAYVNGKFRSVSTDTTVTTASDAPAAGGSGLDSGTVTGGPKKYYVYAVADQDAVKTMSFSFSESATAPAGVTNYSLLGSLYTDASNLFVSRDVVTTHGVGEMELPFAWIRGAGANGAPSIKNSFNITSLTENATGDWTVVFRSNPNSLNYSMVGSCGANAAPGGNFYNFIGGTVAVGSARYGCVNTAASAVEAPDVFVQFIGDNRK